MGLFRWLKRKGSTGSIARWTAGTFMKLVANGMPASEALKFIVTSRFMSPGANLSPGEAGVLRAKLQEDPPRTVHELSRFIWDVEIGSQIPAESLPREAEECYRVMDEELAARGIRPARPDPVGRSHGAKGAGAADAEWRCLNLALNDISRMAKQLWQTELKLRGDHPQPLHTLFVACTSIAAVDLDSSFSDASIDRLASRFGDLDFSQFVSTPAVRDPLRSLVKDARTAAQTGDVEKQMELIMTFLIAPAGAPSLLSESGKGAVFAAARDVLARTIQCRTMIGMAGSLG